MSIEDMLTRIAGLLDAHGETDWARAFHNFLADYKSEPEQAKGKIRSVYGGMGSFNDIILHGANGIPLRDENNELDQLRSDLFTACRS